MSDDKAVVAMEGARPCAGNRRRVMLVRAGKRKLFDAKAKRTFLEYFAATCNVRFSSEQAGIAVLTVWRHRMSDPSFRDAYERALEQGYARIEAKIIETVVDPVPIDIDGDWDVPDLDIRDPGLFQSMLRDRRQRETALMAPNRKRHGPKPGVASEAELKAELVKRLKAFGVRVEIAGKAD